MTGIKTGGRIKGTPNKTTKTTSELKEKLHLLLENQFETIDEKLNNLKPKEQLEILIKLIPYVIPKQLETTNYNETDLNVDVDVTPEKIKELKDLILRMEL
jgi:hypothetical protein